MLPANRAAPPSPELTPMFDFAALLQSTLCAQQTWFEALLAWQKAVLAVQQELQDEWVCRWGGGVPIDA